MFRTIMAAFFLCALGGCDRSAPPADSGSGSATPTNSRVAPTAPVSTKPAGVKKRIAVIPKGTTHDFWKSVQAGAMKAQAELGNVEIIFRGPEKEDDREQQIALVENFISTAVDAIVLAPLDDRALLAPVRQAMNAKIPVIIIDSALRGEVGRDFVSFVSTDNEKGGRLAGQRMGETIGGKGTALLLRYQEGSASTDERERGFVDALAKFADVKLNDPKRYSGATRATAQEASENLLTTYENMQGIFCPNESSTFGMLLALRSRGLAGKVKFVGFDASPELIDALRKGEIDALVAQNPMKMGYLGVKAAGAALAGEKVEPRVDTGAALVTRESLATPEIREILNLPAEAKP
ncbi:MAG: substrate-binding domain-containing protein [Phycisphaerales bacterium]|nr:substrate-binding domain-containing protein [Phycisphaerales bacterium]